ncbi:hypothetical protein AB0I94_32365 [Streptomyces sp. NPDC050147]|uniref:hypothetical protein n=1 Tax=Streptomyces sp. NPDC050147 TaxID=3155513 RepID=UPI00342C31EC
MLARIWCSWCRRLPCPAPAQRLERAATALTANGFSVEILDEVAAARTRIKDLIPEGASVWTAQRRWTRSGG